MKAYMLLLIASTAIFFNVQALKNNSVIGTNDTQRTTDNRYEKDNIGIDMSRYSDNAKLYTANDIFILSYRCGYISADKKPSYLIITNESELSYARENYGLILPENLPENESWYQYGMLSEPFNKMVEKYPLSEYSYIVEYEEVGCDGYDLKVGGLLVDTDILHFVRTTDSKTPDPDKGEGYCDVMDGFCYMAAVPKTYLQNECYDRWIYPGKND